MSAAQLSRLSNTRRTEVAALFGGLTVRRPVSNFVRIMASHHAKASPLGFGYGPSRFSPLQKTPPPKKPLFGLIYGAADLATASYETLIRHRFDNNPSRILMPSDYAGRDAVNFSTKPTQSLTLLDLTGGNAVRHGVPTDVIRYSNHTDGQHFSEFVYRNMKGVDGILYDSRFTEILCIAVYDRAIPKLDPGQSSVTLRQAILAPAMTPWNIAVR